MVAGELVQEQHRRPVPGLLDVQLHSVVGADVRHGPSALAVFSLVDAGIDTGAVEEKTGQAPLCCDRPVPGVLRVRLDRPERRNALDRPSLAALHDAFAAADEPVVVLGSTSRAAFCAGADLSLADDERAAVSDLLYALYGVMTSADAIVVAALDGPAVGGGAQLAIAADLRVASPGARIRVAGPGHGLAVAAWGLPSLVGRGRAMDLCLTMRPVEAAEALAIGLVDRVVEDAAAAALELAAELAALDRAAAARVKRVAWGAARALEALEEERAGNRASWSGSMARAEAARG
jgi:enoyl-CoA hydratase/carnithine racemase